MSTHIIKEVILLLLYNQPYVNLRMIYSICDTTNTVDRSYYFLTGLAGAEPAPEYLKVIL